MFDFDNTIREVFNDYCSDIYEANYADIVNENKEYIEVTRFYWQSNSQGPYLENKGFGYEINSSNDVLFDGNEYIPGIGDVYAYIDDFDSSGYSCNEVFVEFEYDDSNIDLNYDEVDKILMDTIEVKELVDEFTAGVEDVLNQIWAEIHDWCTEQGAYDWDKWIEDAKEEGFIHFEINEDTGELERIFW